MTQIQEERMYELFGKKNIADYEEAELALIVDQMCSEFDQEISEIKL